jgi:D-serine deaminase-like pyridoxal phosphate-dependent protein
MHINELETPVPVVDLDILESNIARLQTYLNEHGIANRPHIKTHKIPAIAQMQIDVGAIGITCQKVGEAEVMADAGIRDIFLPYNIIGKSKLARLMALAKRLNLSVTTDSEVVARGLSNAAKGAGLTLTVLVECDLGMGRCGVQYPDRATELARVIAKLPNLHFGGLMTYPNSAGLDDFVNETRSQLVSDKIEVERISGGGTAVMWQAHTHTTLTEHRAGMYIYGDRLTLRSGAVTLDTCSLRVLATVVSRPTQDRGIIDAGSKTLSMDLYGLENYGYICEYPDAKIYNLSEEHGHVDFSAYEHKPEIGERLSIIPNHCCAVTNLFDEVVAKRKDQVESTWKVSARGKVQ